MSNLLDTILNLVAFAFVGVLVWVYLRDYPGRDDAEASAREDDVIANRNGRGDGDQAAGRLDRRS